MKYIYRVQETGEIVEVEMTYGELMEKESCGFITLPDGREARRSLGTELAREGVKTRTKSRRATRPKWPMVSTRAGVNPSQIQELRDHWTEQGVTGCDVLPNGDVKWDDRASRRRDCESRGLHDRDGSYGDPQSQ